MTNPAPRPALWMLLGACSFAAMATITSALGTRCDWLVIALARVLFMSVSAAILARSAAVRLVFWRPRTLWVRSLAGSVSLVCNFFAMTRLPLADVLTLTNAYPLWIVVLSALAARRLPARAETLGVASGLVGIILIQRPHLTGDHLAAGVAVASSLSAALAMLGLHRLKGVDPRAVVAHFAGVASVVAGTWLFLRLGSLAPMRLDAVTLTMLLGVGATGTVGQLFLTKAYAAGIPARVATISLTQVVFGIAFDAAFWGRSVTPLSLAGIVLVLAPTAWLTSRAGPRGRPPRGRLDLPTESASRGVPERLKFPGPGADPS